MTLLILSILGLGLGPLLDRFARQRSVVVAFLEGFVAATILALVMGHILPEAVETGGWICLPIALVGLMGPQLAEAWRRTRAFRIHGTVAVLALAGLFLHTLMDGAALAGAHHSAHETASTALGIGVVLHRLPVGLTAWWLVQRSTGTAAAVAVLIAICTGTFIGFAAGEVIVAHLSTASIALFQSFVATGQEICFDETRVAVLAPNVALLTAHGRFVASGPEGKTLERRMAITYVYAKIGEEWKAVHSHKSFPDQL